MSGIQPPEDFDPPQTNRLATLARKRALRDQLVTARNRLGLAEIGAAAQSLSEVVMAAPEVRRAATVAAYVSIGSEPGTAVLLSALKSSGKQVLLPALLPDGDLDWGAYAGPDALRRARLGLLEPTPPHLGVDAIGTPDVVLVPALAVDSRGARIGRGGGSYDRALGRVPVGTFVCVLLYDEEVEVAIPTEPHDRPVTAAATPSGIRRFG